MNEGKRVRAAALLALVLVSLVWVFRSVTEYAAGEIGRRLLATSARLGLTARFDEVRVGLFPAVTISGLTLDKPGTFSARTAGVTVSPRLGGDNGWTLVGRISLEEFEVSLPAELEIRLHPSTWEVEPGRSLALLSPGPGLIVTTGQGPRGRVLDIHASQLKLDPLVTFVIEDVASRDLGNLILDLHAEGDPRADFQGQVKGTLLDGRATLSVVVTPVKGETRLEILATLDRLDFARVFAALGQGGSDSAGALGTLSGSVSASGPLGDPAALDVIEHLDFKPPSPRPSSVARLRGDFVHEVTTNLGEKKRIEVSPDSPDFIQLADVPPLFIRALLIAEDAAFFSHPGIDLAEVPKAIATNWARGEPVRGASTITQQLAKNLFLTREKSLHRKLRELSYSFLMESTLGKLRILEIYVNIIEWGPGLYGLRPAARHYFGKEPGALTPKEIAFLVSLIPGPIKYQRSIQGGELGPGFENLVTNLLAKLRSVDALTEEEYEAARAERLVFQGEENAAEESKDPAPIQ